MIVAGMHAGIHGAAVLIEFGGSLIVIAGCLRAAADLLTDCGSPAGIVRARLLIADGVIGALSFKTAATLLKTLDLQSWDAIAFFAAILALRTLVKRVLTWEEERLRAAALPR